MLEALNIRNLALVTELSLDFLPGLNTVTGETGAGKSLIIGALQLLAGGRASAGIIRKGATTCEISGIFRLDRVSPEVQEQLQLLLDEGGVRQCEEQRLLIRRVISETGSRAFVNNSPVTAAYLRDLGEYLIDIHGPNDSQTLLLPKRQLTLLDSFADHAGPLQECRQAWKALQELRQERQALQEDNLSAEEIQLFAFQLQEIDRAEIQADEEAPLQERHRLTTHSRRLIEIARQGADALAQGDNSLQEQLALTIRQIRELAQIDPTAGETFQERLEELSNDLGEIASDLDNYAGSLDWDEEALQEMEARLELLQRLKRKFGPTLADVLSCAERIRGRLARVQGRQEALATLAEREQVLQKQHQSLCQKLHALRQKSGERLSAEISGKLQRLGFTRAGFAVLLTPGTPGPDGADTVEFCFAPNVGEEMQPLRSIASSGEIARVMLAIKTILSDADQVPVLVFDEIDANIGGRVAADVAVELRSLGRQHQVFCITHLPRIAAAGEAHFLVSKQISAGRTNASMFRLEGEERVQEIVRMLGDSGSSATACRHARELLAEMSA